MHIKFRLSVQQHIRLARRCNHLRRIHTLRPGAKRYGTSKITTHTVGRFTEEAKLAAAQRRNLLSQYGQLRRLRMLLRKVAKQHGDPLATRQALGNRGRIGADRDTLHTLCAGLLFCCQRFQYLSQHVNQFIWRSDDFIGDRHQQIVIG